MEGQYLGQLLGTHGRRTLRAGTGTGGVAANQLGAW